MLAPFQRLLYVPGKEHGRPNLLLAASGPLIYSFDAFNGDLLSQWSHVPFIPNGNSGTDGSVDLVVEDEAAERPGKRRKLSDARDPSETPSAEIVIDDDVKKPRKTKNKPITFPSVIILLGTDDGTHIVAATGEDKCLRVLELCEDGSLKQLSERYRSRN